MFRKNQYFYKFFPLHILSAFLCIMCITSPIYAEEINMEYNKSDHYDGKRFFMPGDEQNTGNKSILDIIKWKLRDSAEIWPSWIENSKTPKIAKNISPNEAYISFINHVSFLIQLHDVNILTDPVFSKRVSPFSWLGPKRMRKPGIDIDALPNIHYILISHNHYDHMDIDTLKILVDRFRPIIIVPLGNEAILKKNGIHTRIVELDWWEEYSAEKDEKKHQIEINLTPAQHWSARGLFDKCEALWGGFFIKHHGIKIFFAGDTGYSTHFKEIKDNLGSPTLSLLPIGAYKPEWFMKHHHMNPEEAVLAHIDLQSKNSIAMHFGTFQLADEGFDEPVKFLKKSMKKHNISDQNFHVLDNGETYIEKLDAK